MYEAARHVSATYLSLLLSQFQTEGYSIFVISGSLPTSSADTESELCPVPPPSALLIDRSNDIKTPKKPRKDEDDFDRVLRESGEEEGGESLKKAMEDSLREYERSDYAKTFEAPDVATQSSQAMVSFSGMGNTLGSTSKVPFIDFGLIKVPAKEDRPPAGLPSDHGTARKSQEDPAEEMRRKRMERFG